MNIAYLDPPYSRYFGRLARLLKQDDGSVVAMLSCPSYRLYTCGDRSLVWTPGKTSERHPLPVVMEGATWAQGDRGTLEKAFSDAVEWFKARFREEGTNLCLAFSDARPFSAAARVAAEAVGVTCVYFERGAFRYRTASMSATGLNARFDLRAAAAKNGSRGLQPSDLPARRVPEGWLRTRFLLFMACHGLACAFVSRRKAMQHKRYHFFNYLRIAMSEVRAKREDRAGESQPPFDRPAVLLPLQLPTDSQFVLHSPFRHNQELLDFVAAVVRSTLPGTVLLVKKHPMDVRSYLLPPGARFIHGNLARFYPAASCVICINSTAGFEAAIHGKPVICFGSSFYTSDPHISRTTRERFEEDLSRAVRRRDDPEAGAALKAAVLNQYQVPGDVWAYTEEDLRATVGILLQHLDDVENRASSLTGLAPSAEKPRVAGVRRRRARGAGASDRAVS